MKRHISILIVACLLLTVSPAGGQDLLRELSIVDKRAANESFQAALEYNTIGIASNWHNPDADISGLTVPLSTLQTSTGQSCREFRQTIAIDNREQQVAGTACRQPDGVWRIVDPITLQPVVKKTPKVKKVRHYEHPGRYDPYWDYPYWYYPYWYYPDTLYFSFGYSKHRGHDYYDRDRHGHGFRPWHPDRRWKREHRR